MLCGYRRAHQNWVYLDVEINYSLPDITHFPRVCDPKTVFSGMSYNIRPTDRIRGSKLRFGSRTYFWPLNKRDPVFHQNSPG